ADKGVVVADIVVEDVADEEGDGADRSAGALAQDTAVSPTVSGWERKAVEYTPPTTPRISATAASLVRSARLSPRVEMSMVTACPDWAGTPMTGTWTRTLPEFLSRTVTA